MRVLDVGTDQGVGFIVEEPLTGAVPLSHLLQSGGLAADEVRRLTGEAATALDKASHRGLHHLALTPSALLRMPDGAVKVRGLATEAALTDADRLSDERASRADAVGLVKIAYAGLTGRWPMVAVDDGLIPAGAPVGLEAAPTIVGGVAAPSEIAVGVPNDLDLICRMTLGSGRRGPISPGDLALQIAPWPAEQATSDGATGMRLRGRDRESLDPTRVMPRWPPGQRLWVRRGVAGAAGAALEDRSPGGDLGQPRRCCSTASPRTARSPGRPTRPPPSASRPASRQPGLPLPAWPAPSATRSAPSPAPRPTRRRPEPPSVGRPTTTTSTARTSTSSTPSRTRPRLASSRRCRSSGATSPEAPSGTQSRIALAIVGRPRARGALHRGRQRHEDRPARRPRHGRSP